MPKAIWGFNGTEGQGQSILLQLKRAIREGCPSLPSTGGTRDADDETIPEDVAEKILQFTRQAWPLPPCGQELRSSVASRWVSLVRW